MTATTIAPPLVASKPAAAPAIAIAATSAGDTLGFGSLWKRIPFVAGHRGLV